jgi:hypothetical protein
VDPGEATGHLLRGGSYQAQAEAPVVKLLVCDDAGQSKAITEEVALCWVHDGRHYKKLLPGL